MNFVYLNKLFVAVLFISIAVYTSVPKTSDSFYIISFPKP